MSDDIMDNIFWRLPEGADLDEYLKVMHAEIASRLQKELDEVPGIGILEKLLAERVAFFYIMMRMTESQAGFTLTREHRDTTMLWTAMSNQLRNMKAALLGHYTEPVLQEIVVKRMAKVLASATRELPEDVIPVVQARLEAALAAEGL